jgi:hypothetical protein
VAKVAENKHLVLKNLKKSTGNIKLSKDNRFLNNILLITSKMERIDEWKEFVKKQQM